MTVLTPQKTLQEHLWVVVFQLSVLSGNILEEAFIGNLLILSRELRSCLAVQTHLMTCPDKEGPVGQPYRVAYRVRNEANEIQAGA